MLDRGAPEDPLEVEERLWEDATGYLAFDVGSNMGQSVGRMLERGFSKIVAFEPADESYEILERDYGGDPKVSCQHLAVADHAGEISLAVRAAPICTGQLTATGMPYRGEGAGQPGMANWGPDVGERHIPCQPLDTFMDTWGTPDFVKIDTEGGELKVLQGATRLLAKGPRLLIEFHTGPLHDACVDLLEDAGYDVETVRHPHYPEGTHMYTEHGWLRASVREGETDGEGN